MADKPVKCVRVLVCDNSFFKDLTMPKFIRRMRRRLHSIGFRGDLPLEVQVVGHPIRKVTIYLTHHDFQLF